MRLDIRPATPEDAAAITEVHAAGWRAGYGHMFEPDLLARAIEDRRTRWTEMVAQPDFGQVILLVAERSARIIALAHAGPAGEHAGDLEIYSFYVHPTHWGTGVAPELMTRVLDTARTLGYGRVYLSAARDSARARHFYENAGFHETGHATESPLDDRVVIVDIEYVHDLT